MSEITLNANNFNDTVKDGVTLVDFWANWCGPCKMMLPTVAQLAREMEGRAKVGKVDCDENEKLVDSFGIMTIPAFLIFKNGEPVDRLGGVMPLAALKAALEKHL